MKKISIFIILLSMFIITGCEQEKTTKKVISNGKEINTSKMEHKHCTRKGQINDGEVSLNYDIYYTGDVLNIVKSEEKVISSSNDILNTYEDAYKNIHNKYKELEYYDTNVIRDEESVTSTILINYDKIDVDKLTEIEGKTSNVFEGKTAKVSKWLELAKKFGTKCEIVEE